MSNIEDEQATPRLQPYRPSVDKGKGRAVDAEPPAPSNSKKVVALPDVEDFVVPPERADGFEGFSFPQFPPLNNENLSPLGLDLGNNHKEPSVHRKTSPRNLPEDTSYWYIWNVEPTIALKNDYLKEGRSELARRIESVAASGSPSVRRVRMDGDSFYRASAFAYIERLITNPDDLLVAQAYSILEGSAVILERVGFHEAEFIEGRGRLLNILQELVDAKPEEPFTTEDLVASMNGKHCYSDSIVKFLRLLSSATICRHEYLFKHLIEEYERTFQIRIGLRDFCANVIEATGGEAERIHIVALSQALQVDFEITELVGMGSEPCTESYFPVDSMISSENGLANPIRLLHRHRQYDILYPPVAELGGLGLHT